MFPSEQNATGNLLQYIVAWPREGRFGCGWDVCCATNTQFQHQQARALQHLPWSQLLPHLSTTNKQSWRQFLQTVPTWTSACRHITKALLRDFNVMRVNGSVQLNAHTRVKNKSSLFKFENFVIIDPTWYSTTFFFFPEFTWFCLIPP